MSDGGRTAVVLFSMGGPDSLRSVRPFLFNLFRDPAIISLPGPLRLFLAWLISSRRARPAGEIYRLMGGRSPLLENSLAQAAALEAALGEPGTVRTFVAMRYWHPFSAETVAEVKAFDPDRVVLVPLYPQWSTTTSASSIADWRRACRRAGFDRPTRSVCCYPVEPGFIAAITGLIRDRWSEATAAGRPRVLFSAHGLPRKVVDRGDPYPWQCEQTVAAVVAALAIPDLDWVLCYQSRVGPLEWIGPETDAEIRRAGADRVPVLVVPVAFVSEHSETLVELDIDYRRVADDSGVPLYLRIPTVGVTPAFIDGLARLVREPAPPRLCPAGAAGCARDISSRHGGS